MSLGAPSRGSCTKSPWRVNSRSVSDRNRRREVPRFPKARDQGGRGLSRSAKCPRSVRPERFAGLNCGRWISRLRRMPTPFFRRTRWPWVIAHPGLPQTRTCGHFRIRFLKSRVHCMTKLGTHRAGRSQRVTAKQSAEFLPMHRADVVAAIGPLTPSVRARYDAAVTNEDNRRHWANSRYFAHAVVVRTAPPLHARRARHR